jgi:isoleucyl-tRNA synthetase
LRKDTGLELTDRIIVKVGEIDGLETSLNRFKKYICAEILADSIDIVSDLPEGTPIEVNDFQVKVSIIKND